jgi:hypothetical protein
VGKNFWWQQVDDEPVHRSTPADPRGVGGIGVSHNVHKRM